MNLKGRLTIQSGFTMIELLIVITIIGVLSTITIFSMQNVRTASRDARKKADIEAIRTALELFKADCDVYPSSLPTAANSLTGAASLGCSPANANVYLQDVPEVPSTNISYTYRRGASPFRTYQLCTHLDGVPNGTHPNCAGLSATACEGASCNYGQQNP